MARVPFVDRQDRRIRRLYSEKKLAFCLSSQSAGGGLMAYMLTALGSSGGAGFR